MSVVHPAPAERRQIVVLGASYFDALGQALVAAVERRAAPEGVKMEAPVVEGSPGHERRGIRCKRGYQPDCDGDFWGIEQCSRTIGQCKRPVLDVKVNRPERDGFAEACRGRKIRETSAGGKLEPRAEWEGRIIIVPLDGSVEAETALPIAKLISRITGAAIHVLHATAESESLKEACRRLRLTGEEAIGPDNAPVNRAGW